MRLFYWPATSTKKKKVDTKKPTKVLTQNWKKGWLAKPWAESFRRKEVRKESVSVSSKTVLKDVEILPSTFVNKMQGNVEKIKEKY